MARMLAVILAVLLLAGCGAGASLPTATSTQPQQTTTTAATSSPTPSQTVRQATASGEVTPTPEPISTLEESTPAPTSSYPLVTITDLEPGPGRDVGSVAATDGKNIFYTRLYDTEDSELVCKIICYNPRTKKSTVIRSLSDTCVRKIFTDYNGTLYYINYEDTLFKYNPDGDMILASYVQDVVRVDHQYIYYLGLCGTVSIENKLMAYRIQDDSIVEVENKYDIVLSEMGENNVTWRYANGNCQIDIKNTNTMQTRKCTIPASAFPIVDADDFEVINIMKGVVVDDTLVLVINSPNVPDTLYLYKVNIKKNKVLSKKELPGKTEYVGGVVFYQDKIYIYTFEEKDDYSKNNRKIHSYTISTGKLRTIKWLADSGFEDGLVIEAVGGYLWVGSYSNGDGTGYWDTYSIPLK